MLVRTFHVGPMDNNVYVIVDEVSREALMVDPAFGSQAALDAIAEDGYTVRWIVFTHAHLDHIAENARAAEATGAPVAMHPGDRPLLDALSEQASWFGVPTPRVVEPSMDLADGMALTVGAGSLRVVHTPGHSPGSVCLVGDGWAIVGDLVFAGGIGRADLPGGDYNTLLESIHAHILCLGDDVILYPGHGPATTVGRERRSNPYLV